MKKFIETMLRAANQFKAFDFAIFKIYLVSVGILLGAYFAQFWLNNIIIIWVIAILSAVITITQLIRYYLRSRKK